LQDSLPTFPDEEAFACIERELGFPLDSIYSTISPSPIAAASLGQVYKARLKYSGKLVAVKVQRPGIEDAIGLDFYLLRGLGFLINKYVDIVTSDVVALMDEFARRVFQELNYVQVHSSGPCELLSRHFVTYLHYNRFLSINLANDEIQGQIKMFGCLIRRIIIIPFSSSIGCYPHDQINICNHMECRKAKMQEGLRSYMLISKMYWCLTYFGITQVQRF